MNPQDQTQADELEKLISSVKSNQRMILRDDPIGSYWEKEDGQRKLLRIYADSDNYWAITTEELKSIDQYADQRFLKLLEELSKSMPGIQNHASYSEPDIHQVAQAHYDQGWNDLHWQINQLIKAKRLNLTKKGE